MRRLIAGGVSLAWCLAAGSAPVATDAGDTPCSAYAVRGIAPGMRPSEVRARMGSGGAVESVKGASGLQTGVTYATGDIPVYVLYDRDISKHPDARVVLVRARGPTNAADPAAFVRSIVPGLGEPVLGGEHLADGLRNGVVVWEDRDCAVEVTAYRQETDWWRPGQRDLYVQIEPSEVADAVESATDGAPDSQPSPPEAPRVAAEAAVVPPAPAPDAPVAPSEEIVAPTRIAASCAPPRYPLRAQRMRIPGSVVLRVQVKGDGSVGEVEVLDTTRKGMGFEQAAVDAVKTWRYQPATRGGKAEDAVIAVRINFE